MEVLRGITDSGESSSKFIQHPRAFQVLRQPSCKYEVMRVTH